MIERATVVRTEGERVILACDSQGCKACSSLFCRPGDRREFPAINPERLPLQRSDRVRFYVEPRSAIGAGFIVLIMPLIVFAAMYFAVGLIRSGPSEQLRVLAGFGGLLLGFAAAYLLGRNTKRYPIVVGSGDEIISPTA